jgi:hypothetical protein
MINKLSKLNKQVNNEGNIISPSQKLYILRYLKQAFEWHHTAQLQYIKLL